MSADRVDNLIFYLKQYSDPEFLLNFNNKIKKEFNVNLSYINKFKPFYFFPHYHIEENRERIEKFVNPYQPLYFSLWDKNKNDIIEFGNFWRNPRVFIYPVYVKSVGPDKTKI